MKEGRLLLRKLVNSVKKYLYSTETGAYLYRSISQRWDKCRIDIFRDRKKGNIKYARDKAQKKIALKKDPVG